MLAQRENAGLDRTADLEHAAQVLDLPKEVLQAIKNPRLELVSRDARTDSTFYLAADAPNCEGCVISLSVRCEAGKDFVVSAAQDLQLAAGIAGLPARTAAGVLHFGREGFGERELWQAAQAIAPVLTRNCGEAWLLPCDMASAGLAEWISQAAARFGGRLHVPVTGAAEFCSRLMDLRLQAGILLASTALQASGKRLAGARICVVGDGSQIGEYLSGLETSGARVVAVADESGGIVNAGGLPAAEISRHLHQGGLLVEYDAPGHASRREVLSAPTDGLVLFCEREEPAAAGTRASVVVDVSGNSISWGVAQELSARSVTVIGGLMFSSVGAWAVLHPEVLCESAATRASTLSDLVTRTWEGVVNMQKRFQLPWHGAQLIQALAWRAESVLK